MPGKAKFNAGFDQAGNRGVGVAGDIAGVVWRRLNQGVMGGEDATSLAGRSAKGAQRALQFGHANQAVFPESSQPRGAPPRRVQTYDLEFPGEKAWLKVAADESLISSEGAEESPDDVPEGYIVVAGDDQARFGEP